MDDGYVVHRPLVRPMMEPASHRLRNRSGRIPISCNNNNNSNNSNNNNNNNNNSDNSDNSKEEPWSRSNVQKSDIKKSVSNIKKKKLGKTIQKRLDSNQKSNQRDDKTPRWKKN